MIGEITPLVKWSAPETWLKAVTAHLLGTTMSAGLLGLLLGTFGMVLGLAWLAGTLRWMGVLLLMLAIREAGLVRWRLPSLRRQTPRWFREHFSPTFYSLLWGLDLGQGWTTHIVFSAFYGLIAWAVILADPFISALTLAAYGFGRGLPVLTAGIAELRSRDESAIAGFARGQEFVYQLNAFALAFVGGWLIFAS